MCHPFFEKWYNEGDSEYIYHTDNARTSGPASYDHYRRNFGKLMESMGMNYTPHATRHTFSSLLADVGVDSSLRSRLCGQSTGNINETVYTHLDMSVLLEAVNKLECFMC